MAIGIGFRGHIVSEHYGGDGLDVSALNRDDLGRILPAAEIETVAPSSVPHSKEAVAS